ncbi:MAG: cytochrome b/b6 domain-containing protein [Gammaproteobacteria bacterium]|jgi:cytochrome b
MQVEKQIKVWDPLVRSFHWVLAGSFLVAYASGEDFLTLHSWAGYIIGVALLIRIVWGFVGTPYARFKDFVTSPGKALQYAKDTLSMRAKRYIGHNPAGGLMIITMIVSLLITTFTGIALFGAAEQAGPMASLFAASGSIWEDPLEEIHEFFANFALLLVAIHVAGVIVESLIHRENLVGSMISGFKRTN